MTPIFMTPIFMTPVVVAPIAPAPIFRPSILTTMTYMKLPPVQPVHAVTASHRRGESPHH